MASCLIFPMNNVEFLTAKAVALLKAARHAVALTGAGVSTPSGIPDFRSPESGLWEQADSMEVASLSGFLRRPQAFYDWIYPLAKLTAAAQPNAAHRALAQLEANGWLQCVITQNIDMLHTKAGSQLVYEVHGHMREVTCMKCQRVYTGEPVMAQFLQTAVVPHCEACAGVLKPNVILFGELLPQAIMAAADWHTDRCDVMLVAGSSLEVLPVSQLPWQARCNGARLIIINYGETYADEWADVVIHANVADVLPRIAAALPTGANLA